MGRRWVPAGNMPQGRGINPADIAARLTRRKRAPQRATVDDGFGSVWPMCDRPDCDLHVVRPGVARCEDEERATVTDAAATCPRCADRVTAPVGERRRCGCGRNELVHDPDGAWIRPISPRPARGGRRG